MALLSLHPSCPPGPIESIEASVVRSPHGFSVEFEARGEISQIVVPGPLPGRRTDGLWKSTCFELFWQGEGQPYYREYNFSPSGEWAAYDFSDARAGMRDAQGDDIAISCSHDEAQLVMSAAIGSSLALPARIGLSAVVEDVTGTITYWALHHAKQRPDFHDPSCFIARLS